MVFIYINYYICHHSVCVFCVCQRKGQSSALEATTADDNPLKKGEDGEGEEQAEEEEDDEDDESSDPDIEEEIQASKSQAGPGDEDDNFHLHSTFLKFSVLTRFILGFGNNVEKSNKTQIS